MGEVPREKPKAIHELKTDVAPTQAMGWPQAGCIRVRGHWPVSSAKIQSRASFGATVDECNLAQRPVDNADFGDSIDLGDVIGT